MTQLICFTRLHLRVSLKKPWNMQLELLCAREVIKDQFFSSDMFITNRSGTGPRLSDKDSAFRTVIFFMVRFWFSW